MRNLKHSLFKMLSILTVTMLLAMASFAEQSVVSPDGKQSVFIKEVKECPYTPDTGWFPSDYDEIWAMNADGTEKRCIISNNYAVGQDMQNYLGSFDSLCFSPDSKHIYFLCQNSATNALLYRANADGTNIKQLGSAHDISGVVGGDPEDTYYGCVVVHSKKVVEGQDSYSWVTLLLSADGMEIKEIDNIDEFWSQHSKV